MNELLIQLKALNQNVVSFEELYRTFRSAMPEQYMHSDGGISFLKNWLLEMKGQGRLRFSTAAGAVLKGIHTLPAEIRLPQPRRTKATQPQRQWHPAIIGEEKGAKPERLAFLEKLDTYLKQKPKDARLVPIKARSLQIFGDEKLLGKRTDLKTGRVLPNLMLDDLDCYVPNAHFLFCERYRNSSRKVLVVENSETFHVMHQRNCGHSMYRAIVYGAGNSFAKNAPFLDSLQPPDGDGEFFYFGDVDIPGFEIPMKGQSTLHRIGSEIVINPALDLYREALEKGKPATVIYEKLHPWEKGQDCDVRQWTFDWFIEDRSVFDGMEQLAENHQRIAQEWIGLD